MKGFFIIFTTLEKYERETVIQNEFLNCFNLHMGQLETDKQTKVTYTN